jgi:hypothetical protein
MLMKLTPSSSQGWERVEMTLVGYNIVKLQADPSLFIYCLFCMQFRLFTVQKIYQITAVFTSLFGFF